MKQKRGDLHQAHNEASERLGRARVAYENRPDDPAKYRNLLEAKVVFEKSRCELHKFDKEELQRCGKFKNERTEHDKGRAEKGQNPHQRQSVCSDQKNGDAPGPNYEPTSNRK